MLLSSAVLPLRAPRRGIITTTGTRQPAAIIRRHAVALGDLPTLTLQFSNYEVPDLGAFTVGIIYSLMGEQFKITGHREQVLARLSVLSSSHFLEPIIGKFFSYVRSPQNLRHRQDGTGYLTPHRRTLHIGSFTNPHTNKFRITHTINTTSRKNSPNLECRRYMYINDWGPILQTNLHFNKFPLAHSWVEICNIFNSSNREDFYTNVMAIDNKRIFEPWVNNSATEIVSDNITLYPPYQQNYITAQELHTPRRALEDELFAGFRAPTLVDLPDEEYRQALNEIERNTPLRHAEPDIEFHTRNNRPVLTWWRPNHTRLTRETWNPLETNFEAVEQAVAAEAAEAPIPPDVATPTPEAPRAEVRRMRILNADFIPTINH